MQCVMVGMKRQLHIVPSDGEWAVRETGREGSVLTAPTQAGAIAEAAEYAIEEEIDIVVHRRDGTFRNIIGVETLQRRAEDDSCKICGMGPKVFWSILAVGAVGGLAAYLIVNPPAQLDSVRRDVERQIRNLKRRLG